MAKNNTIDYTQDWSSFVRKILKRLANRWIRRGTKDVSRLSELTGLTESMLFQMRSDGAGGIESWFKLAAISLGMTKDDVEKFFEDFESLAISAKTDSELEDLLTQVKKTFPREELKKWCYLVLASAELQYRIEQDTPSKSKRRSKKKKS